LAFRRLAGLLALLLTGSINAAAADDGGDGAIRLLSDDEADVCIQDADCMRGLFLHAAFGEASGSDAEPGRLIKWGGPLHVATLAGGQLSEDAERAVAGAVQEMKNVAAIAGAELTEVRAEAGEVVNVVLLVSDDFARDRDTAFADLLSNVFAGRTALYDALSSGSSPVCRAHLFAERDGIVSGGLALVESDVDAADLLRCVHRSVLNVIGFRHPLPDNVDSVLNPDSEREAWTSIDFILLKMLNDPAVRPGMSREEITAAFSAIHQRALRPSS
jgi:hypothetical protein